MRKRKPFRPFDPEANRRVIDDIVDSTPVRKEHARILSGPVSVRDRSTLMQDARVSRVACRDDRCSSLHRCCALTHALRNLPEAKTVFPAPFEIFAALQIVRTGHLPSIVSGHNASMSMVTVQGWRCAVCHYEWLKTGRPPIRCASRRCRSRKWNRDAVLHRVRQHAANCKCAMCRVIL